MIMQPKKPQIIFNKKTNQYRCTGAWTILKLESLSSQFKQLSLPTEKKIILNGKSITEFDSAGALALFHVITALKQHKNEVELVEFTDPELQLLELIESKEKDLEHATPEPEKTSVFYEIGKETENKIMQIDGFIILIGDLSIKFVEALGNWRHFQLPSIISVINSAGLKALPIIGLLSFLIGVVLAYQMGLQLETYGANIFIAYLSGMAIFREFAPLITAIIVAGRTSSAFTAQIGSMKVNEEVDAILTMGLSPTELLVMPKVLGLILVFPLLIFWADIFSIFGAMIMSKHMLSIGFSDYLERLKDSVGVTQLMLGLYKAPVFAVLIALVGCFQGFKVAGSADSIGSQTTRSVVQALFLIIIADAVFSVIYSWMKL